MKTHYTVRLSFNGAFIVWLEEVEQGFTSIFQLLQDFKLVCRLSGRLSKPSSYFLFILLNPSIEQNWNEWVSYTKLFYTCLSYVCFQADAFHVAGTFGRAVLIVQGQMEIKKHQQKLCSSREDKTNSGTCKGHRRGKRSSTCIRMLRSSRVCDSRAVLVAGCYAAAEVVIVEQYNSTVCSTHTVKEVVVAQWTNHQQQVRQEAQYSTVATYETPT